MKLIPSVRLTVLFMLLIALSASVEATIPVTEREALIAFYDATNGPGWTNKTNWLGAAGSECTWYGVECTNGSVTRLFLDKNNLSGSLPAELKDLPNLRALILRENAIGGSIPFNIGSLDNLVELYLDGNSISGNIPNEIGGLVALQRLHLTRNQLSGALPESIGSLTELDEVGLGGNELSGAIPAQMGNLVNLVFLDLSGNGFSESIPAEMGSMMSLERVYLNGNSLSGSLPSELGSLSNLRDLRLEGNRLSGEIPLEFVKLSSLVSLDLRFNGLFSSDDALVSFLNSKQTGGDWQSTQTVAPLGLNVEALSASSARFSWTLIPWNSGPGSYELFASDQAEGSYSRLTVTADKLVGSVLVKDLAPELLHFRIRTVSEPHQFNSNRVVSDFSPPSSVCFPPSPFLSLFPSNGATVGSSITLSWEDAEKVSRYDVFFSPSSSPAFFASTSATSLDVSGLELGTTYYWSVVARGACDSSRSTATSVRSFTVSGDCSAPGEVTTLFPVDGAELASSVALLSWSSVSVGASYDVYLGTSQPPSLLVSKVVNTELEVAGLVPEKSYHWKVVARAACDDSLVSESSTRQFVTAGECPVPGATSFTFLPPGSVGLGQPYTIAWRNASDLGQGGYYQVERSLDAGFATILDTQKTDSAFATFIADDIGTYYHRVRAVAGCDPIKASTYSAKGEVSVIKGRPSVVFTVQPEAEITELNADLSTMSSRFVLENISPDPVTVIIGRQEINSESFFTIVDPAGSDGFLTLDPRTPKEMEVRFSGPSTNTTGSYQGVIFLASTSTQLTITPYAFVNLKVGGQTSVTPQFIVDGAISSYAFFPPWSGDDASRPAIEIGIRNPGSTPMELGAEIGPEVWLVPESGWNATPLAANEVRTVKLFTQRNRAPAGSPLPRYTYLTIRTRDGKTARLLVQDNDERSLGSGREVALASGDKSLIVPDVVSEVSSGSTPLVTQLRLSNMGSSAVQADLYFTPSGASGLSSSVKRVTVVVPPNDVVTLTDPLVQLYGLARPAKGQIEIRAPQEILGLLNVTAGVVSARGTASALAKMPVVSRGEGALTGAPHRLVGVAKSTSQTTSVVLAETTGREKVTAQLRLYDKSGTSLGEQSYVVEPYGHRQITDVVTALGGGSVLDGGHIIVTVTSGGGALVAVGKVSDTNGENTATVLSEPMRSGASAASKTGEITLYAEASTTLALPMVVQGPIDSSDSTQYETLVGFVAPSDASASFTAIFTSSVGSTLQREFTVSAGQTAEHKNVLSQLFNVTSPVVGSMSIQTPLGAQVYSWLISGGTQTGSVPVINTGGTLVSSATGSSSPLHFDGMEQSTDPSRGTRWNVYIQETAGQSGKVRVSMYEAANRAYPIVEKDFPVAAGSRVPLETVFSATGLDSTLRRKDRTNVLCVVRPIEGGAAITATAVEIDNATGAVQVHPLEPGSGLSSTLVTVTKVGGTGGDANGDGVVTVSDIFYLINNLFAGGPAPAGSGDANGDGAVTVSDIFYLINHLFAGGPAPG